MGYIVLKIDSTEIIVPLFCDRKNHKKRTYRIQGSKYQKELLETHHKYIHKNLHSWVLGSKDIYQYVHVPSPYLEEYMTETFGCLWSQETKWWVRSETAKKRQLLKKLRF